MPLDSPSPSLRTKQLRASTNDEPHGPSLRSSAVGKRVGQG